MHFDAAYREEALLRDGTTVLLRLVRPADKALFVRGMERLSPQSRYLRFFTPKDHLTERELAYLTEVDHVAHFALGAVRTVDGSEEGPFEEGLGVGRFVVVEPNVAEAAIAVIDDMHGRGLGRLLLLRLVAAARERGVEQFRCEVLADNVAMRDMLRALAPDAIERSDGGVLQVQLPIPPVDPTEASHTDAPLGPLYRLFAMVAERLVHVRAEIERLIDLSRRRE